MLRAISFLVNMIGLILNLVESPSSKNDHFQTIEQFFVFHLHDGRVYIDTINPCLVQECSPQLRFIFIIFITWSFDS